VTGASSEAESEEIPLRRFDWRFLLPAAEDNRRRAALVIGGSARHRRWLRELRVADEVLDGAGADRRRVDLVVALGGNPPDPAAVAGMLAPGGIAYLEIDRVRLAVPRFWIRAFVAHGLTVLGRYAVLPGYDAAKVYLPVDRGAALGWVVDSLVPASTRGRWIARTAFGLMRDGLRRLAARTYPRQALIVGSAESASSLPAALRVAGCGPGVRPLLLCDAGNRVVMLPFGAAGTPPDRAVKVPKRAVFNDRTRNEHESLAEIRAAMPPHLRTSVPIPAPLGRLGDLVVSTESYVGGTSLLASSGDRSAPPARRIRDLQAAADWLGEFHKCVRIGSGSWDRSAIARWVDDPTAEYLARFGSDDGEERLLREWRERARSMIGVPFPTVWWHRDFNVWNLYRRGRNISVIDWEGARPGPPLCDLLHLSTHWYEAALGLRTEPDRRQGFRTLFLSPGALDPHARAVWRGLADYLERLGLDSRFVPLMLVFLWVELTIRRDDQLRDQGAARADVREANRNFAYLSMLASGDPWGCAEVRLDHAVGGK
jgi:aminoglycoside phosphotransferase (APT) family kinase protein